MLKDRLRVSVLAVTAVVVGLLPAGLTGQGFPETKVAEYVNPWTTYCIDMRCLPIDFPDRGCCGGVDGGLAQRAMFEAPVLAARPVRRDAGV